MPENCTLFVSDADDGDILPVIFSNEPGELFLSRRGWSLELHVNENSLENLKHSFEGGDFLIVTRHVQVDPKVQLDLFLEARQVSIIIP